MQPLPPPATSTAAKHTFQFGAGTTRANLSWPKVLQGLAVDGQTARRVTHHVFDDVAQVGGRSRPAELGLTGDGAARTGFDPALDETGFVGTLGDPFAHALGAMLDQGADAATDEGATRAVPEVLALDGTPETTS